MEVRIGRPRLQRSPDLGFTRYAKSSRVPAALLLFGLIAGIRALRQGRAPTAREAVGLLIASLGIAIAASFVPEVVVAFLAALLFVVAIDETGRIVAATNWVSELLNPPNRLPARAGGI